ncbi:hypothetical protein LP416_09430 [Polaromonas sp. P2-4]|nr:hypothetical protein LP416_09430 [Polaromonas sp. P2-4]
MYADAGDQGVDKRPDANPGALWHVAMRPGKRKARGRHEGQGGYGGPQLSLQHVGRIAETQTASSQSIPVDLHLQHQNLLVAARLGRLGRALGVSLHETARRFRRMQAYLDGHLEEVLAWQNRRERNF